MQVSDLRLRRARGAEQGHRLPVSVGLHREQTGGILLGLISFSSAGIRPCVRTIYTESGIILPRYGVTHCLAGDILDRQPGLEQGRQIDDAKQQHQQDRQSQRKLEQGLGAAGRP